MKSLDIKVPPVAWHPYAMATIPSRKHIVAAWSDDTDFHDAKTGKPPRPIRTADDLRTLRLVEYFLPGHSMDELSTRSPVYGRTSVAYALMNSRTVSVAWSKVSLNVMHCKVPPSTMLYSFNAALVGLCCVHEDIASHPHAQKHTDDSDLPSFLASTPLCDCLGLGIVAHVDPASCRFQIITPIPVSQLASVNTLLRGPLSIPALFLHSVRSFMLCVPCVRVETILLLGVVMLSDVGCCDNILTFALGPVKK